METKRLLKKVLNTLLLIILAAAPLAAAVRPAAAEAPAAPAIVGDTFGYQLTQSTLGASEWATWVEASSGGTRITFDEPGNPQESIALPFAFKFYELTRTSVSVSTNGLLLFETTNAISTNYPIPHPIAPNAYAAPFWAIMDSSSADVYYKPMSGAVNYVVIQWKNVSLTFDPASAFNFEVKLYANGDMAFLYQTMTGTQVTASVGIEAPLGGDGIEYSYHQEAAVAANVALLFDRPADQRRVTAVDSYASGMLTANVANILLTFRNTGDLGADVLQFPNISLPAGWSYKLLNGKTSAEMPDIGGNMRVSPEIAAGANFTATLQVKAPSSASIGEHVRLVVKAESQRDTRNPKASASVTVQAAVPTSFSYPYADENEQNNLSLFLQSPNSTTSVPLQTAYPGDSIGVQRLRSERLFYVRESKTFSLVAPVAVTNIDAWVLDRYGNTLGKPLEGLTNHLYSTVPIHDAAPVVAEAANGNIAIIFTRVDNETVRSVYLLILRPNPNSEFLYTTLTLIPVTQSTTDNFSSASVVSIPANTAYPNGRFVLAWQHAQPGIIYNIDTAAYTADGAPLKAPGPVTSSGATIYRAPTLASLSDGNVALAYSAEILESEEQYIAWQRLNSNGQANGGAGNLIAQKTTHDGQDLFQKDMAQLSEGGPVLLAWVNKAIGGVSAVLLTPNLTLSSDRIDLSSPTGRDSDQVSVSNDIEGHGMVAWLDVTIYEHYYYALLSENGALLTPPMYLINLDYFKTEKLIVSSTGQGLAALNGYFRSFLPLIKRGT